MSDLKPCPFCGEYPIKGGRMLSRDRMKAVEQVTHPVTDKCALDMLVFRLDEWNQRATRAEEG